MIVFHITKQHISFYSIRHKARLLYRPLHHHFAALVCQSEILIRIENTNDIIHSITAYRIRYSDGRMICINCTAVEDEVANSRFQRSELDWLIYNDPLSYAELILNGDPEEYLRTVTVFLPSDFI